VRYFWGTSPSISWYRVVKKSSQGKKRKFESTPRTGRRGKGGTHRSATDMRGHSGNLKNHGGRKGGQSKSIPLQSLVGER